MIATSPCSSFLFHAEDGIRDYKVTGVQACALPISGTLAIGQAATMALTGGDQTLVGVPLSNAGLVTVNLGNTNALVLNGGTSFNNTSTGTLRDRKSVV